MMKITKNKLLALAVTAIVGIAVVASVKVNQARERAREAALRADSIEAALDTTRLVIDDTVSYWQRRAIQAELERDDLDERLEQETEARVNAEAQLADINTEITAPVQVDSQDVRSAIFDEDTERYALHAEVVLPPAPELAVGNFNVNIKPIPIEFRLACQETDTDINRAQVGIIVPQGVRMTITRALQTPLVCNPQLYETPGFNLFGLDIPEGPVLGALTGAGTGYVVGRSPEDALGGALIGTITGWALDELLFD